MEKSSGKERESLLYLQMVSSKSAPASAGMLSKRSKVISLTAGKDCNSDADNQSLGFKLLWRAFPEPEPEPGLELDPKDERLAMVTAARHATKQKVLKGFITLNRSFSNQLLQLDNQPIHLPMTTVLLKLTKPLFYTVFRFFNYSIL